MSNIREVLAMAIYVEWCLGSTIGTVAAAKARWAVMEECGKRVFYRLADVAIETVGRRCMACSHESAEEAGSRL